MNSALPALMKNSLQSLRCCRSALQTEQSPGKFAKSAEDELCCLNGQYIPFAKTKEEREKASDPRLSVEERYKDLADYVQRVSQAARTLVDERFLLVEDAERLIAEARKAKIFAEGK